MKKDEADVEVETVEKSDEHLPFLGVIYGIGSAICFTIWYILFIVIGYNPAIWDSAELILPMGIALGAASLLSFYFYFTERLKKK